MLGSFSTLLLSIHVYACVCMCIIHVCLYACIYMMYCALCIRQLSNSESLCACVATGNMMLRQATSPSDPNLDLAKAGDRVVLPVLIGMCVFVHVCLFVRVRVYMSVC